MDNVNKYNIPVLVVFGNPLLDICVQAPANQGESICKEFGLSLDSELEVSSSVSKELQKKTSSFPRKICCGGSALNTCRVLQWLLGTHNKVMFSGSLGKDDNGRVIQDLCHKDGIITKFAEHSNLPTGVSTVLVHGVHRTLVAHIGAAQVYEDVSLLQEILIDIQTSQMVFMEGYFGIHNSNVCLNILRECQESGTCLAFTLSSVYLYENPSSALLNLVQKADIVIGNEREFRAVFMAIGKEKNIDSLEDVLHSILKWGKKEDSHVCLKLKPLRNKGKIVICTRGKNSVVYGEESSRAITYVPVPKVDNVVDGTGAGDSFASGVVLGVILQRDLTTCCQIGNYAAGVILQQVGCELPDKLPQTLDPKSPIGRLVW